MSRKNQRLWGFEDTDELLWEDPEEFITDVVEGGLLSDDDIRRIIAEGGVWVLHEFMPIMVSPADVASMEKRVLDFVLYEFGEDYGCTENESARYSQAEENSLHWAAKDFIKKILEIYVPCKFEPTGETWSIDMAEWLKENGYGED